MPIAVGIETQTLQIKESRPNKITAGRLALSNAFLNSVRHNNISNILPKSSFEKISFSRAATNRPMKLNTSHQTHWNDKMFMSFPRKLWVLVILTFLSRSV